MNESLENKLIAMAVRIAGRRTLEVEKYSSSTLVKDCSDDLWAFLALNHEEVHGLASNSCGCPTVKDFGQIWTVKIGREGRVYGHNLIEALEYAIAQSEKYKTQK